MRLRLLSQNIIAQNGNDHASSAFGFLRNKLKSQHTKNKHFSGNFRALSIHPCECVKATDDGLTIICLNTNLASLSLALANIGLDKTPIDSLLIDRSHIGNY